jgi:regulator of sirC expression with transglutaminase-like and TPR domain
VEIVDPTKRFAELVQGPEAAIPLDEAALLVAAHAQPGLDVAAQLRRLDEVAAGVAEPTLDGLRRHLFVDLGFSGNDIDYHDPRNSFLNEVLDRRTGIPISLSILTIEVGRRVGAPLAGVGMPGHFLVRDRVDPDVFVDPFARGAVLDRAGCEARFRTIAGPAAVFDDSFLEPVGTRSILARVLANLRTIYVASADTDSLAWVLRLRLALPDVERTERRSLASVLATQGRYVEGAEQLELLATEVPDEDAAAHARAAANRLRAKLN